MSGSKAAVRVSINGIVQGVGFRPFVYQLARDHGLAGQVANTAMGVVIQLEGAPEAIDACLQDLPRRKPPLAHIVEIQREPATVHGFDDFRIVPSVGGQERFTLISPDVAVCDDCLSEMRDSNDRRHRYPFINCTNCGPRYTIITDVPYDRPKTAMRHFSLCEACRREYDDPSDRRFHAQPNACPVCGPSVWLCDRDGQEISAEDPIAAAAEALKQGQVLALKGLGGFHLAVDAQNEEAVRRLRRRKRREEKPFALMAADLSRAGQFVEVDAAAQSLLESIQRPIVLLPKREGHAIASGVAPGNAYFGVMLPYTPLHHLVLAEDFLALVMTSGNLSEEPICIANADALERLGQIADLFLMHNRDIYLRSDDSIVRQVAGEVRFLRRSRGYVPVPVFLRSNLPRVLAVGGELKNTICLTRERFAFLSQHIGDMENRQTEDFFQLTIDHLQRILDIRPEVVAYDLHPDYLSTRYAQTRDDLPVVGIQHHHAHIVSCLAEHQLEGRVIGLAMDGTGYGPDHTVWGGEVLIAEAGGYTRAAHLQPVAMPGSASAIREPWRMAVSFLEVSMGEGWREMPLPLMKGLSEPQIQISTQMIRQGLNSPLTSSLGRLFDAVAAILGLHLTVAFEGQAAMALEHLAADVDAPPYAFRWGAGDTRIIDTAAIIRAVCSDVSAGMPSPIIAARFHETLVQGLTDLCEELRRETGLDRVVLSGGVFQNRRLLAGLLARLGLAGFSVFAHRQVPTNDGGLALGQAVAAAAMMA
ncbi:MAG: carbamoyltransferase HypF [Desulfosarcinaceae bacterium]|nr:carbamoyltransferase HypF [Desulfosarcinaceae bacterium]